MKKSEMISVLVEQHGIDADSLKGKSKGEIEEIFNGFSDAEQVLNAASMSDDNVAVVTDENVPNNENVVDPLSVEWTPYVMSLFDASELERGMPKVAGLRRVTEKLMGPYNVDVDVINHPKDSDYKATVKVRVSFVGTQYYNEAAADVSSMNTDRTFSVHAVATAETRAEGRALRKALKLSNVLCAEEAYVPETTDGNLSDKKITPEMIAGIKAMCVPVGVDPLKLGILINPNISEIDNLSVEEAKKMVEKINEFRNKPDGIPKNVKS